MGRAVILAVILNEQRNTASGIADAPRDGSGVAQFARKAMRSLPTQARSATTWIAAAMLAMTWALETQASSDEARHLADAQRAMAPGIFNSGGRAGYDGFEASPPSRGKNDKSLQVAQATPG